jgi:uncharacterized protein YaiL (DUF2058 family)
VRGLIVAKSLQEQLLTAGVVAKDRAQKLKKQKHKQDKQRARGAGEPDAVKRDAEHAQAEKAARDRTLSRERQALSEAKALAAQVRQLIEKNAIAREQGEIPYNFSDAGIVKKITVSPHQHAQIVAGRIAIARLDGSYLLIAAPVAAKIAERDPASVIVMNTSEEVATTEDSLYAEYQIPDDLTW